MADGSNALSSSISIGKVSITEDDAAFDCEMSDRFSHRAQDVMRGIMTVAGLYMTGGIKADFQRRTSKFPLSNMRIIVQMDATCIYYAIYDHANKRILIYSGLGSEVAHETSLALTFPFLGVGE